MLGVILPCPQHALLQLAAHLCLMLRHALPKTGLLATCPALLAGSFLYTSPYFTKLPIWDRLTALPLLGPLLEVDSSNEAYQHYDQITALELFNKKGVTKRLLK